MSKPKRVRQYPSIRKRQVSLDAAARTKCRLIRDTMPQTQAKVMLHLSRKWARHHIMATGKPLGLDQGSGTLSRAATAICYIISRNRTPVAPERNHIPTFSVPPTAFSGSFNNRREVAILDEFAIWAGPVIGPHHVPPFRLHDQQRDVELDQRRDPRCAKVSYQRKSIKAAEKFDRARIRISYEA